MCRATIVGILVGALALPAVAQVRLVVRPDGRKVIQNLGSGGSHKSGNLAHLAKQHDRRSPYDDIIDRHAATYGVDPVLVRAVIQVESDFNPRCVSNKGARGLMQLMPETARRYGVRNVFDPEENIRGGVHYLSDLLHMFSRDLSRSLAAYNAGEGAVTRHGGVPPYSETLTYVDRALTVYYGRPVGGGASFAAGKKVLKGGFSPVSLAGTTASTVGLPASTVGLSSGGVVSNFRYLGTR